MSLDFFNMKEGLEKNETLSKVVEGVTEFIEELSEALQNKNNNDKDIVTQISSDNKLSIASENEIIKVRNQIVSELANNTKEEGTLYFILNKIKGENSYRVWEFNNGIRTQIEIEKNELPENASVNSVLREENGKLVISKEETDMILNKVRREADKIIEEQNKKIEDYKKEGHTYLVTEDINGRVFLWDTTEKPKFEIEDVYFPEELKNKAKEGNSFIYKNGTYEHIL